MKDYVASWTISPISTTTPASSSASRAHHFRFVVEGMGELQHVAAVIGFPLQAAAR
jgi:hypothetical protein